MSLYNFLVQFTSRPSMAPSGCRLVEERSWSSAPREGDFVVIAPQICLEVLSVTFKANCVELTFRTSGEDWPVLQEAGAQRTGFL